MESKPRNQSIGKPTLNGSFPDAVKRRLSQRTMKNFMIRSKEISRMLKERIAQGIRKDVVVNSVTTETLERQKEAASADGAHVIKV